MQYDNQKSLTICFEWKRSWNVKAIKCRYIGKVDQTSTTVGSRRWPYDEWRLLHDASQYQQQIGVSRQLIQSILDPITPSDTFTWIGMESGFGQHLPTRCQCLFPLWSTRTPTSSSSIGGSETTFPEETNTKSVPLTSTPMTWKASFRTWTECDSWKACSRFFIHDASTTTKDPCMTGDRWQKGIVRQVQVGRQQVGDGYVT